jgi:4-amino-4-deoxy-L-arabinose transferase
VALAVIGLSLLATLGIYGLLEPTETRYAEIAREMRVSGDWLRPRLDGLSHFHKPPLAYWATALGMSALGDEATGARLAVALASIVLLASVGLTARRRRFGVTPGVAIWVLGTMLLFVTLGRALASDPFLAAAVGAYWALAPSSWAIAALGVGFLAKGPVVFVHTALPVLLVALWRRDRGVLEWLGPPRGWLWFGAIGLPWYLMMALRTPGLLSYLLGNQVWERFATTEHQRGGPPWYFLGVMALGTLPWTAALVAGIARTWRERRNPEAQLLLSWLVAPVVFLSFSGSKLPAYVLPCLPAAALLAARGIEARVARRITALVPVVAILAILVTALPPGSAWLGWLLGHEPRLPGSIALPGAIGAMAFGLAALWLARARPERAGPPLTLAYSALLVALSPHDAALGSPRQVVRVLAESRGPGEPVVEIADFNAGLPFYLRETVRLLEVPREPAFDDPARVRAVLVTRDSLAEFSRRHPRVWTFGPEARCGEIAATLGLRYTVVARWRKDALGFVAR